MKTHVIGGLALGLLLSACQQHESPKNQTAVFRLFDLFQPTDLTGTVTPENAGWNRIEWRAQDMAPWTPPPKKDKSDKPDADAPPPRTPQTAALAFRALNDLSEPKVSQGQLTADITGPAPVL